MAIYVRSAEFMMHRYTESKAEREVVREGESGESGAKGRVEGSHNLSSSLLASFGWALT